jgi:motility quorum-sensing regulator/GCU-specific mRNA interferase toxin
MNSPLDHARGLLSRARDDFFVVSRLAGEADAPGWVLDFHAEQLFKSMATNRDHRVWQDVYHAPCPNGKTAYIKLTIQAGTVVVLFKEL